MTRLLVLICVAVTICSVESGPCLKDKCKSSPCVNGGVCTPVPGDGRGYSCTCPDEYTGTYCEVVLACDQKDPCNPSPCLNGGACAPTGSDGYGYARYKCTCKDGFQGFDCEVGEAPPPPPPVPLDPCTPNPCKNHEACEAKPNGDKKYTCTCPPQYTGCACELEKVTTCPTGFTYLSEGKSCYKILSTLADWDTHMATCKALYKGADLAKITSKAENDGVVAHIKTFPTAAEKAVCKDIGWYIGLQRKIRKDCKSGFEWKSVTTCSGESVSYYDWNTGEPNCSGTGESCVHIYPLANYHWNDLLCETKSCAVCELSLY